MTHKYGIRVPRSIEEAKQIDEENGDTRWMDSVRLEMKNSRVAFQTFEEDVRTLVGYKEITGHIVFDVKLSENFRRKARFCADGHKVETPSFLTYSTVVSRDSVRIILMIAALNGLDLQGADIQKHSFQLPTWRSTGFVLVASLGLNKGKFSLLSGHYMD